MEKYKGYWVKVKKENVFLRFPMSAQAGLSNPSTMFAYLLSEGKRLANSWILSPEQAIADSGDSAPSPMGDFSGSTGGGGSSVEVGGDVGCFIATAAHGRLYP